MAQLNKVSLFKLSNFIVLSLCLCIKKIENLKKDKNASRVVYIGVIVPYCYVVTSVLHIITLSTAIRASVEGRMMKHSSFEQLVVRRQVGYVCDAAALIALGDHKTYDGTVFKIITKLESHMLLISSHSAVDQFTVDVLPKGTHQPKNTNNKYAADGVRDEEEVLEEAWHKCEAKGFHGLLALALFDPCCMPDNGCREKYSFPQYIDSLIHSIEAYFMFQKPNPLYALNAVSLWQVESALQVKSCYIVMAWKLKEDPRNGTSPHLFSTPLHARTSLLKQDLSAGKVVERTTSSTTTVTETVKRKTTDTKANVSTPATKRGRRSMGTPLTKAKTTQPQDEDNEISFKQTAEVDDEITFKKQPEKVIIPEVRYYSPNMSPKKDSPDERIADPIQEEAADVTFGFEKSQARTPGRKSSARKSLVSSGWSEEVKEDILQFFDNLNPSQTEQTSIALTCKFANMKYDQELSSKLLYQWVQKKGRPVSKTVNNYQLPVGEQKETMISFFKSLNPELSEGSRVAFTCKFMHTQFGLAVQSKEFYNILNDKGKKTPKRR